MQNFIVAYMSEQGYCVLKRTVRKVRTTSVGFPGEPLGDLEEWIVVASCTNDDNAHEICNALNTLVAS